MWPHSVRDFKCRTFEIFILFEWNLREKVGCGASWQGKPMRPIGRFLHSQTILELRTTSKWMFEILFILLCMYEYIYSQKNTLIKKIKLSAVQKFDDPSNSYLKMKQLALTQKSSIYNRSLFKVRWEQYIFERVPSLPPSYN